MLRWNGCEVVLDRSTRTGETRSYGTLRFDGLMVVHDPNAADSV